MSMADIQKPAILTCGAAISEHGAMASPSFTKLTGKNALPRPIFGNTDNILLFDLPWIRFRDFIEIFVH